MNVIFPGVDFMVAYITPVLKAANADKRIMVLSTNADLAPMQTMAAGGSVKADVGNPIGWDAWGAVDQAYRAIAKIEDCFLFGVDHRRPDATILDGTTVVDCCGLVRGGDGKVIVIVCYIRGLAPVRFCFASSPTARTLSMPLLQIADDFGIR